MGGGVLALDTILSASFHFVIKWSPELDRTKSRDLLRFVLCRLYDAGRGNLHTASLALAQTTVARKLGLSRQWVGVLVQRLETAGWIEHYSPVLPDGTKWFDDLADRAHAQAVAGHAGQEQLWKKANN